MKIAVVVPFYNEEKNLIFFLKEWSNYFYLKKKIRNDFTFFFINDGSTDNSVKIITKKTTNFKFKIINKKNTGHSDSCRFAYKFIIRNYKKFNYIMQIDSDNQCNPKYLDIFLNLILKKNFFFIFGYRFQRADGYLRYIFSRIMSYAVFAKKFLFIKDLNVPYRIMRVIELKKILKEIDKDKNYKKIKLFNCLLTYVIQKKYPITWINIVFRKRYYGKSKYSFVKMAYIFLNFIFFI
jgi:hypothetical protein